eukprot:17430-Heterococcus_DN1.PRE.2
MGHGASVPVPGEDPRLWDPQVVAQKTNITDVTSVDLSCRYVLRTRSTAEPLSCISTADSDYG